MLRWQLGQLVDCPEVRSLVVYVTHEGPEGQPTLMAVGQWPSDGRALPPPDRAGELRVPAEERRWLPLREGPLLLGALQVETVGSVWSDNLRQRLQAMALTLTEALRIDIERQRLEARLLAREEHLRLLVHQLRNPLSALRTFGHLLLRRLDKDNENRSLVEGLLNEEQQLNRYVEAISDLARPDGLLSAAASPQPLLLPPLLTGPGGVDLAGPLLPLLRRAEATANLQGRQWHGPANLPSWRGDSGAVAEILANLLENAFRYSPAGCPLGLHCGIGPLGQPTLTIWDGGEPIDADERQSIFNRGERGRHGLAIPGTGLGLALARDLARGLGGDLELVIPPSQVDPSLPNQGNAFQLSLPPQAKAQANLDLPIGST